MPSAGAQRRSGRRGPRQRDPLAARVRARGSDALDDRRRAPADDRARIGGRAKSQRDYLRCLSSTAWRPRFWTRLRVREVPEAIVRRSRSPWLSGTSRCRTRCRSSPSRRRSSPISRASSSRSSPRRSRCTSASRRRPSMDAGCRALLAVLCNHLGCSLALVDEGGRVLAVRHARPAASFDSALELPVVADDEIATLRAPSATAWSSVSTTCSCSITARLRSPSSSRSATPCRPPSFVLPATCSRTWNTNDWTTARPRGAWPLRARAVPRIRGPARHPTNGLPGDRSACLYRASWTAGRALPVDCAARTRRPSSSRPRTEEAALALGTGARRRRARRAGRGRPAGSGRALGRSLLEARAALDACRRSRWPPTTTWVARAAAQPPEPPWRRSSTACSARPRKRWLIESLSALLDAGCRWSDAAERLGVHRHTLRYRMERLREQTGRHRTSPSNGWSYGLL